MKKITAKDALRYSKAAQAQQQLQNRVIPTLDQILKQIAAHAKCGRYYFNILLDIDTDLVKKQFRENLVELQNLGFQVRVEDFDWTGDKTEIKINWVNADMMEQFEKSRLWHKA